METIIKKAIEGGWKPSHIGGWAKCKNPKEVLESFHFFYPDEESIKQHRHYFEYFSDPLFWQALGKACGWKTLRKEIVGKTLEGNPYTEYKDTPESLKHATRFHEINLTEGWEKAVEYLNNLIKQ